MLTAWLLLCGTVFLTQVKCPSEVSGEVVGETAATDGNDNSFRYERAQSSFCKAQWHPFGEKCYKIFGLGDLEMLNWEDAAKACSNNGGDLATIYSQDLQDYLTAFLLLNASATVWIGLHDRVNESSYSWQDGSVFNFTNWRDTEPSGPKDEKEDCVEMIFFYVNTRLGEWNDIDCSWKRPYLCQMNKGTSNERFQDPRFCSSADGWSLYSFCYFIHTEAKSWEEAENFCLSKYQGHLATVNGITVDVFLEYVLREYKVKTLWIGISLEKKPLRWSSGWHVFHGQWTEKYLMENDDQVEGSCVSLSKNQKWIGDSCRRKLPFICETSSVKPPKLKAPPSGDYHCPEKPSDWMDLDGEYCYFLQIKDSVSWYEASYHCMRRGGSLCSFHSMEEILGLEQFLRYTQYILHIGLLRKLDSEEFVWEDGSEVNFTNWDKDEPNSKTENCTELRSYSLAWNDINCDAPRKYVCSVKKIAPIVEEADNKDACRSGLSPFEMLALAFCVGLVLLLLVAVIYYFKKPDKDRTRNTSMVHLQPPEGQRRYRTGEIVVHEDHEYENMDDINHRDRSAVRYMKY